MKNNNSCKGSLPCTIFVIFILKEQVSNGKQMLVMVAGTVPDFKSSFSLVGSDMDESPPVWFFIWTGTKKRWIRKTDSLLCLICCTYDVVFFISQHPHYLDANQKKFWMKYFWQHWSQSNWLEHSMLTLEMYVIFYIRFTFD